MTALDVLLEAFAAAPATTPQQSLAAAPAQIAAAKSAQQQDWNAAKHPRTVGGKFGTTTGGVKTATTSRTLRSGTRGSMVASIQKQLGLQADGVYGPQTKARVEAYQRAHGLQVDGVIGRQTLAALRGHTNPGAVAPGAIQSRAAVLHRIATKQSKERARAAKTARYASTHRNVSGGQVIA